MGIIDGDYHLDSAKQKWEKDSIFCLKVSEIENLLCDEKLLQAAHDRFLPKDDNSVDNAKKKLFHQLKIDKTKQALKYTADKVNYHLSGNLIDDKANSLNDLNLKCKTIFDNISSDEWYNERITLIENIIENEDYDQALTHYNFKGMLSVVTKDIANDYSGRIIKLISVETGLQLYIKEKYFAEIVKYIEENIEVSMDLSPK